MTFLRRCLLLLPLLALAACGDETPRDELIGKWQLSDPGGKLLGGRVEFHSSGTVIVMERWQTPSGMQRRILSGTYRFVDPRRIEMELSERSGERINRAVGISVNGDRLTLGFMGGSIVYRRISKDEKR